MHINMRGECPLTFTLCSIYKVGFVEKWHLFSFIRIAVTLKEYQFLYFQSCMTAVPFVQGHTTAALFL